eukprot:936487-Amphidinium_carterae.1
MKAWPPGIAERLAQHNIPATPLSVLLTTTSWDSKTWQDVEPTDEDAIRWNACRKELDSLVGTCFTGGAEVEVAAFGSTVSGFRTKRSDLDVVLLEKYEDQNADKRLAQVKILEALQLAMRSNPPTWT